MAETKKDALVAFDAFVEIYAIKYEKAVECLTKDRYASLAKGLTFQRNDSAR
jgi:putative transposase